MDVFHADPADISDERIRLAGDEFRHLARVMRKRPGDELYVTDGAGMMYAARLERLERDHAVARILERLPRHNETPRPVILAQALLRQPARMDWVVEKATELGVARIIPVLAEHSTGRTVHRARWQSLALAAAKQCMRAVVPPIDGETDFAALPAALPDADMIVCHETATGGFPAAAWSSRSDRPLLVCIGPEGGFSQAEIACALAAGARIVSLGPRRLRGETAAVAALSYIMLRMIET